MPTPIARLRNIGAATADRLAVIGIRDRADLEAVEAAESYRRLQRAFPSETSLNALYAMHGALLDLDWRDLPPGLKEELRRETDG